MTDANAKADIERRLAYFREKRRTEAVDRVRRVLQEHFCRHVRFAGLEGGVPMSETCATCALAAEAICAAACDAARDA